MKRLPGRALALVLLLAACATGTRPAPRADLVVLVSLDGFRWDYLQRFDAPTLRHLADTGVHVSRLVPSFPSRTFPNHFTLVTGLRPEHHGIVGNTFYDPALGAMFNKSVPADNTDPRWWQGGEPVWITAEKQGVRTAAYFWPGDEAEIHGARPERWAHFDPRQSSDARVDAFLHWLDGPPASRPRFAALYLDVVDTAGHKYGPEAPETAAAVHEADAAVARLCAGLAARHLLDRTDLVVVSDHGMSEQSTDRVVFLEDLMNVAQVQVEATGPNAGVRPRPGGPTPAALAAAIRARAPPSIHVYLRDEVPADLHFHASPRIPPVMLLADDHWNIESKVAWPMFAANYNRGNHGWDPADLNMGALFVAAGPDLRRHAELGPVDNIHVYDLLCALLGIRPAPNDGDERLTRAALAP